MSRSIATVILLLLSCLHFALAFNSIEVPSSVTTGEEMQISIDNDFSKGPQSYDREFDSFRVFLSVSFKKDFKGNGPSCLLMSSVTMGTAGIAGKVPSDVGEDGAYYAIGVQPFNQNPNNRTVNNSSTGIVQYSDPFTLTDTNGTWAQFERDGRSPGYAEFISCRAYNCVRNCYNRSYPGDWTDDPCGSWQEKAYNCFAECPNTIMPNWPDEIISLYGADCSHLSFLPMPTMTVTGNATTITIHQSATGNHVTAFTTKDGVPPVQTSPSAKTSHTPAHTMTSMEIWAFLVTGILAIVVGNLC